MVLLQQAVVGEPEPEDPLPPRATTEAGVAAAKTGSASVAKMASLENMVAKRGLLDAKDTECWGKASQQALLL